MIQKRVELANKNILIQKDQINIDLTNQYVRKYLKKSSEHSSGPDAVDPSNPELPLTPKGQPVAHTDHAIMGEGASMEAA